MATSLLAGAVPTEADEDDNYDQVATQPGPEVNPLDALDDATPDNVTRGYAKAGAYQTDLPPEEQKKFDQWVKDNHVPYDPSPTSDYDMRGFWKGLQSGDPHAKTGTNPNDHQQHFSDYWKTPYHKSFSRESQYATEQAPAWNDKDQLVDRSGKVVYDERADVNPLDALDDDHGAQGTADAMNHTLGQVGEDMPEITVSAQRGPEASWGEVAAGVPTAVGAKIESKLAGGEEYVGNTVNDSARKKLWQSIILPEAVRSARDNNIPLTEDPQVVDIAHHLGIRPDQFTRDWPTYANQSDEQRRQFQATQRERLQTAQSRMAEGSQRRQTAAQVSEAYRPNIPQYSAKSLAFDTATMIPDLLAGTAATVATGGIGGVALMGADIAPEEYASARNQGLSHRDASTYATLSTLASSVPEIPVMRIVENAPLARKIIGGIVGDKFAQTATGKVIGTSVAQGVTQATVQTLQEGIDEGLLDKSDSLQEALKKIAYAGLTGAVAGAPLGALHAATSRTPKGSALAPERQEPSIGPAEATAPPGEPTLEPQTPATPGPAPVSTGFKPGTNREAPRGTPEGEEQPAKLEGDDLHAALDAVQKKTVNPGQLESLEAMGLATRNDVNVPRLLPAGRRELTRSLTERASASTARSGAKPLDIGPESTQNRPDNAEIPSTEPIAPPKEAEVSPTEPEVAGNNPEPLPTRGEQGEFTGSTPSEPTGNRLLDDGQLRDSLAAMKAETGWAQVGGRLLRHPETGAVTGRTPWVPNAEWWPDRPKGLKETQIHAAVDKALAGKPLNGREQKMVDFMVDVHDQRQKLAPFLPEPQDMPAGYDGLTQSNAVPVDDAHETALVGRLADLDEGALESLAKQHEDDRAGFLRAVKAHLDAHDRETAGAGGEGRQEATVAEGRRPYRAGADLFGQDTGRAQELADEIRRRDEQRSPNKDVSADIGKPGDLFSEGANRQVDLEDALGRTDQHQRTTEAGGIKQGSFVRINKPGHPEHGNRALVRSIFRHNRKDPFVVRVEHEAGGQEALETHELEPLDQGDLLGQLDQARKETNTAPTEGQKAAGNYKKGSVDFAGLDVAIENPKGSTRSGKSAGGKAWSRKMGHDYGYVRGTTSKDGEGVDVFLTGKADTGKVFVINQVHPDGSFDESKSVLGASSAAEARDVYHANYPKGWKGLGSMVEMSTQDFQRWAHSGGPLRPARETERLERRGDVTERKRVTQMTPEELRKELLTHDLTGIPNRRAYVESDKLPTQVSIDVDSLKAVNDIGGHHAGDELLKTVARVLSEETDQAYHLSGDEFAAQALHEREAHDIMKRVTDRLKDSEIIVEMPDGRMLSYKGLGVSYGVGEDLGKADAALQGHKKEREAQGLRTPRGETPQGLRVGGAEEGREDRGGPSAPEKETVEVKENAATYSELAPVSGPAGGVEGPRKGRAATPGQGSLDFFAPKAEPAPATRAAGSVARSLAKTQLVRTGHFASGISHVTTWVDAAHVMAPLRKMPQESMLALVTDEDGKVLSVIRHTTGLSNASYVHPGILSGAVARVPGAREVWFAHNHPSGVLHHSGADNSVTDTLENLLRGSGIESHGMIVVGPGERYATWYQTGMGQGNFNLERIPAKARTLEVPIQERRFARILQAKEKVYIADPNTAAHIIEKSGEKAGLLLLDNRHNLVATFPMTPEEMTKLRTGDPATGTANVLRQAEMANASAAIPFGPRENRGALSNLTNMLRAAQIEVVDGVMSEKDGTWTPHHGPLNDEGIKFYSRKAEASGAGLNRTEAERLVRDTIRKAGLNEVFPHVEVHQDIASLPPELADKIMEDQAADTTGAVYDPATGTIHLIADNNGSPLELQENLWHEAVGHHGLRLAMDRAQYSAVMDGIYRDMPERVEAAAQRNGLYTKNLAERRAAAEEVVAYAAGQYLSGQPIEKPVLPFWNRTVRAVKSFFARIAGRPFYDEQAIAGLITRAYDALEGGGAGTAVGEPARSTRAPTFYSPVERAVEASKQGKASAEQWMATIKKSAGIKPEELEWLDLENWLKGHKGPITKEELGEYVRANRLELQETVHGGATESGNRSELENLSTRLAEELRAMGHRVEFDDEGYFDTFYRKLDPIDADAEQVGYDELRPDDPVDMATIEDSNLRDKVAHLDEVSRGVAAERATLEDRPQGWEGVPAQATKYDEYTLPGGQNYREMLMRLPSGYTPDALEIRKRLYAQYQPELDAKHKEIARLQYGNEADVAAARVLHDEYTALQLERDRVVKAAGGDRQHVEYRSSHWQEPNILAHVRFNERTDADGKKVLFLEELQSDWHQAGRKRGYQSELPPETRTRLQEIDAKLARLSSTGADEETRREYFKPGALVKGYGGIDKVIAYHPGTEANRYDWSVTVERVKPDGSKIPGEGPRTHSTSPGQEIRRELEIERRNLDPNRVPDAPFKTSWPMLTMKRMIRWAAEHGFDKIAWTKGEQQAERYGLEKHVTELMHQEGGPKGRRLIAYGAQGDVAADHQIRDDAHLEELIGKELAQRLMAAEPKAETAYGSNEVGQGLVRHPVTERTLSGIDLKTGGEGMKGFYDQILPRETDKLIKKYGGKVGSVEMGGIYLQWNNDLQKDDFLPAPVHSFDITPEMRQAALGQGFPMFARRQQTLPLQQPKPTGYERIKRAVDYLMENPVTRDVRALVHPVGLSADSKQAARVATEYLGKQAHDSVVSQEALEHFSRSIEQLPVRDQLEMMDAIERGAPQPHAELQPAADQMRRMLDEWREKVRGLGIGALDNFIEDYFPHYWADERKAQRLVASIQGRRPLKGPASFLKMRTIPTIKEGMDAGLRPLTTNPLTMTLLKTREMQRFVTGVTLMKRFKEDGLAKFLPSGRSMPDGWAGINDNIAKIRSWSEEEQGFIERGQYIMPEDAARVINNHVSQSAIKRFAPAEAFRVTASMLNALQLGFSAFHLGFTTLDAIISKTALGIESLAHGQIGRAVNNFSMAALGPIAAVDNIRRGSRLLKAYSNPVGATPEMARIVNALQLGGGRAHMDRYYLISQGVSPFRGVGFRSLAKDIHSALTKPADKIENVAKAVGNFAPEYATKLLRSLQSIGQTHHPLAVPFELVGRIVRASTSFIMEHVVPMQKLGVFADLAREHMQRNPLQSEPERAAAMQRIWASVDNRLGEMVYDNLFWNRSFKDTLHFGIRAVGWNVGTVREIAGAPIDAIKAIDKAIATGKITAEDLGHKIPYVMAMTMTSALYGAMLNYLYTGEGPQELKDYFFPRTGGNTNYGTPQRVSLPSYVKDVYEYSQRPGTTVLNKLNPIFNVIGEMYNNEDFFGNPITDPDATFWEAAKQRAAFVASEATPFSLQGRQQLEKSDQEPGLLGTVKRVLPAIGVTPAPGYVTSPEQMERRERFEREKKYTSHLKYLMNKAVASGDKAAVKDLARQYVEAARHMKQTEVEVQKDRARSAISRRKAATSMRQQGLPVTANLVASLPLDPDPKAREFFAQQLREAPG